MTGPERIMGIANAFHGSCVLFAACELGVFEKLEKLGGADAETVAREGGLDRRGTEILLDACVAIGLLSKESRLYRNTDESSRFLVPGSPSDLSKAIRYNQDVYTAWGKLSQFARSGKPVESQDVHLGGDPERTENFVMSMHYRALAIGRAVIPQLPISGKRRLFDVGGGPGTYAMLMAEREPSLHCTVLDLPEVVGIARELIEREGMSDRIVTVAGDYRSAAFPSGNDVVTFFGVLHQEHPDMIRELMRKAYEAMVPGGVVIVLDMMTDATHTRPPFSALFAVNMALTTEHGWVFADAELREWMESAGFRDFEVRPLPPPMPHWLAIAEKPK